jgi:hypothetical protein
MGYSRITKPKFTHVDVVDIKMFTCRWAPMAHIYNPSYSGGRDQEDQGLKSAQANSSQDPISKIHNTKRAGRVAQVVRVPA